jgi:two-component system alkaline phosphatase synthesis response regulator PhoP
LPFFQREGTVAATILIVDDEVHLARIIQLTLEHAGYETLLAFDGEEALELVRRRRPSLVILDLMLPLLDGYKVCNRIKQDEETKRIPVMILSARDLSRERIEEPFNADLFMAKPFDCAALVEKVAELLEKGSGL